MKFSLVMHFYYGVPETFSFDTYPELAAYLNTRLNEVFCFTVGRVIDPAMMQETFTQLQNAMDRTQEGKVNHG